MAHFQAGPSSFAITRKILFSSFSSAYIYAQIQRVFQRQLLGRLDKTDTRAQSCAQISPAYLPVCIQHAAANSDAAARKEVQQLVPVVFHLSPLTGGIDLHPLHKGNACGCLSLRTTDHPVGRCCKNKINQETILRVQCVFLRQSQT